MKVLVVGGGAAGLMPARGDHPPCAHVRIPMDMIFPGADRAEIAQGGM